MKKINWFDHFVNLVVVIAGISVAFMLGNWKSSNDRVKNEKEYFRSFILDLDKDIEDLDSMLIDDSLQQKAMIKLLAFDSKLNVLETGTVDDSTNWAVGRLAQLNTFSTENTTYESMKSSGKFDVLKDFQIKMQILGYYHTSLSTYNEVNSYYKKNFDDNILPFFIEQFSELSVRPEDIFQSGKFRTIVQIHSSFLGQKMQANRACLDKAIILRGDLNEKAFN